MNSRALGAVLAIGIAVWVIALAVLVGSEPDGLLDLRVYRTGGLAWLQDVPLYDQAFPAPLTGPALPFTYPPLAAVLFAGLTVLPWWAAVAVLIAAGLAGLIVTCWLAADRLALDRLALDRGQVTLLAAATVAVAPVVEPVHETVAFGQVNLIIMGMIAADCLLRRTPWPRGALIGLAAAIKLTPAAFLLFFIARRQWRPVLVAGIAGALLAPSDSRAYWFGALLEPARIGGLAFTSNQSLRGMLHRLGLPVGVETLSWLTLSAAVGLLAVVGIGWLLRRGDELAALLVTAAAALLVSPVSWSHHWVWVAPGLLWLVVLAWRRRLAGLQLTAAAALPAVGLLVFVTSPHWWLPYRDDRELSWSWWQHLVGNAYLWCALAVVIVAAAAALRERARSYQLNA